jgi:hypothetical protein
LNYPLLLGSWQGQALVSLHKLTKTEGLQILDGVGLLETFYARGYLPPASHLLPAIDNPQRLFFVQQEREK